MNVINHASLLEAFQFVVAIVGLMYAMWGLWVVTEDAVALAETAPNDLRRLVALGNARAQLARVSVHGLLVFMGVVSILLPPPPMLVEGVAAEVEQSMLVRFGLVAVTVILTIDVIFEKRHRDSFLGR